MSETGERGWMERQRGYDRDGATYSEGRYGSRIGRAYLRFRSESLAAAIGARFGAGVRDVLELGCGPGLTLAALAESGARHRLVGLDFSETMLGEARARVAEAGGDVELLLGNAIELPFAEASFDVVYATRFIHQFPHADKLRIAAQIARVLRPGGLVLLEAYARPLNWLRYYVDRHDLYPTREAYFSHYPSRRELREIAGPDFHAEPLRYAGDKLPNRVLGYRAYQAGRALVKRVAPLHWLIDEYWLIYTPPEKVAAAPAPAPPTALAAKLRCPRCRGHLDALESPAVFACRSCALAFDPKGGIPNLLSHEARALR